MDLDNDDQIWTDAIHAAADFGAACATFRNTNPFPQVVALDHIINTLMTELWDQGFSQSEIRTAFEDALADMNRYAAGEERRS
ncbi:hypothetical protein [Caulobacter sp.]|uniref:hypothetical protein n=1 Tax=Caulobacter sp. TaxID=78 RepID=UPI003BAE7FE0